MEGLELIAFEIISSVGRKIDMAELFLKNES